MKRLKKKAPSFIFWRLSLKIQAIINKYLYFQDVPDTVQNFLGRDIGSIEQLQCFFDPLAIGFGRDGRDSGNRFHLGLLSNMNIVFISDIRIGAED